MLPGMGVDMDPTVRRSFKFERGLDELIALYREILQDFRMKSEKIIDFIRPKLPVLACVDHEPSVSTYDMLEFDA
jgi:hypothetical protein